MRVCVCGVQIPYSTGGAEILVRSLAAQLAQRGFETETVFVPFTWKDRVQLFKSCLAWRLLDLSIVEGKKIDLLITTRFPSYLLKHPNKVVWLVHQLRQIYDLHGTGYSDFQETPRDRKAAEMLRAMDVRTLSEARRLYAISSNVGERLKRFNGLTAQTLYPPPQTTPLLAPGPYGDYVFTIGRLDPIKRFDQLVRALRHTKTPVRAVIAGTGSERDALLHLAEKHGVADRLELPGRISDEELVALYSGALAVYYAPYDEDYGYVTVEAGKSAKPVLTLSDSGGVLEFVDDGKTGYVCPPDDPPALGARLDTLFLDRVTARAMGEAAHEKTAAIAWDPVIAELTG